MLVTLTKKNLQIISMESYYDSDSFIGDYDSARKILELNKKNYEIHNKLKELLHNPINEDSIAQIIELLDAMEPNNKWTYESIKLIGKTKKIRQNKEIIKSIINMIPHIKLNMCYKSSSPIDEILLIIENNKEKIDSGVYNQFTENIVVFIDNIDSNKPYNSLSVYKILVIAHNNKKKIDNNVYNKFIKSIVAFIKNINFNTQDGYNLLSTITKIIENNKKKIDDNVYNEFIENIILRLNDINPNIKDGYNLLYTITKIIENNKEKIYDNNVYNKFIKSIVAFIGNINFNTKYGYESIKFIYHTEELQPLLQDKKIIEYIVPIVKDINHNNEYEGKSLCYILGIIYENKEKIYDNVYNEFIENIILRLKYICPNIADEYELLYSTIRIIKQNKKNIPDSLYNQFIKNIAGIIKGHINPNKDYGYRSINVICKIKELREEPEIIESIVDVIKKIDTHTLFGCQSIRSIIRIIIGIIKTKNKNNIDSDVYNQWIEKIVSVLRYTEYNNYHKNYSSTILELLKLLMTDLIDNEKLIPEKITSIQKNKKLIEENEKLIQENETLIQENETLIQENKKLIQENKKLIQEHKTLIQEHKTLMKNILPLMTLLNRTASYNACYIKDLLDFMIDKKLIHHERLKKALSKGIQKIDLYKLCTVYNQESQKSVVCLHDLPTIVALKKKPLHNDKIFLKELLEHKALLNNLSEIQKKNFSYNKNTQNVDFNDFQLLGKLNLMLGIMHPTQSNTTSSKKKQNSNKLVKLSN